MLEHHPLTPEQAVQLFVSVGVGAFLYSAALVPWTEPEMRELEGMGASRQESLASTSVHSL